MVDSELLGAPTRRMLCMAERGSFTSDIDPYGGTECSNQQIEPHEEPIQMKQWLSLLLPLLFHVVVSRPDVPSVVMPVAAQLVNLEKGYDPIHPWPIISRSTVRRRLLYRCRTRDR